MQIQLDEIKLMKKKMEEQNKIRDEMNKVNQQLHYLSNIEKEENRLADLKVINTSLYKPKLKKQVWFF